MNVHLQVLQFVTEVEYPLGRPHVTVDSHLEGFVESDGGGPVNDDGHVTDHALHVGIRDAHVGKAQVSRHDHHLVEDLGAVALKNLEQLFAGDLVEPVLALLSFLFSHQDVNLGDVGA